MKTFMAMAFVFLLAPMSQAAGIQHSAGFAKTVCRGTEFWAISDGQNSFKADLTLEINGDKAKLNGFYESQNKKRTQIADEARESNVDPENIPVTALQANVMYVFGIQRLLENVGKMGISVRGLRFQEALLTSATKMQSCQLMLGKVICNEVEAAYGSYIELVDPKGRRVAGTVVLEGGWAGFDCNR